MNADLVRVEPPVSPIHVHGPRVVIVDPEVHLCSSGLHCVVGHVAQQPARNASTPRWGVNAEVYVQNVIHETPITGSFLNTDDSGLTTNVFTLDPRLVGVSLTKRF